MTRPLLINLTPGLPAPGAPGLFLCEVEGRHDIYLLRWVANQFRALGWRIDAGMGRPWPELLPIGGPDDVRIVGHVPAPSVVDASPPESGARAPSEVEGAAGEVNGAAAGDQHLCGVRSVDDPLWRESC